MPNQFLRENLIVRKIKALMWEYIVLKAEQLLKMMQNLKIKKQRTMGCC